MADPTPHRRGSIISPPEPPALPEPPTPLGDVLLSTGALIAMGVLLLWAAYWLFSFSHAVVQDQAIHGQTPRHRDDSDPFRVGLPALGGLALFAGAVLLVTACRTIYRQIRGRPLLNDHDFDEVSFDRSMDDKDDE